MQLYRIHTFVKLQATGASHGQGSGGGREKLVNVGADYGCTLKPGEPAANYATGVLDYPGH